MTPLLITVLATAALLGGFVQGLTGFGFAMVTSPILMLFMAPTDMIFLNLCLSVSLGILTFTRREARQGVHLRTLLILVMAMLPGQYVGVLLLPHMNGNAMKILVLTVIGVSCLLLWFDPSRLKAAFSLPGMGLGAGLLSGILTPTTGVNGPPVVLYLLNRFEEKARVRSTTLAYLLLSMGLGIVFMLRSTELGGGMGPALAWGAPFCWAGFFAGALLFERVSHARFKQYALWILLAASVVGIASLLFCR